MKKAIVLLVVASMLAGCADGIPDPTDIFTDCESPELMTETGTITVLENESYNPISIGNESKWFELVSYSYTATHLSFEVVNNSVIFNNLTFDVNSYLYQEHITNYVVSVPINSTTNETTNYTFSDTSIVSFDSGYAPNIGLVYLYVSDFDYDITIEYTISYKVWTGKEC